MPETDAPLGSGMDRTTAPARSMLAGLEHPVVADLLTRLSHFDRVMGPQVDPSWRAPQDWGWLAPLVQACYGWRGHSVLKAVNSVVAHAGDEGRALLAASLLRALSPRNGLLTVALAPWFDPHEVAAVSQWSPKPVTHTVDLRQAVGQPLDYRGYLCVILKVTRLCNLRCVYCHDWSDSATTHMTFETLLRVTQQTLGAGHGAVDFVLHGGEPLMLGRRAWLRWMLMLAHLSADHQIVRVHLQTNGVLVDDEWVDLLALFDVKASVSLDGPPEWHNRHRPDALGRDTHARALSGARRLRERGLLSGVLMVVTPPVLQMGGDALQTYFQQEGIHELALIPQRPAPGESGGVPSADFVDLLLAVDRANRRSAGPPVRVRELVAVERLNSGHGSGFCELAGNCVGAFISVEANGDVSHCDKYTGSAAHVLGNLMHTPLAEILAGAATERVAQAAYAGLDAFRACPHFAKCQGWCPHERFVDPPAPGARCCGLSRLFEGVSITPSAPVSEEPNHGPAH